MASFDFRHIPVESEAEFVDRSLAELEQMITDAIADRGKCVIGLSGGSTPKPIYAMLGSLVSIQWEKMTVFLVDDRYVPADDEDSNQNLLHETLLKNASIPESQIIVPDTSLPLEECIEEYDRQIDLLMQKGIDAVTLGLGEDGHIASLFPGDIDAILEQEKYVLHTETDRFAVRDRVTVTMPVLESASHQFFFLKGKDKKDIFGKVMAENIDPVEYPAHALLNTGKTTWVTCW